MTTNSTVNPNAVGVYTIKYTSTDPSGNSATNTRTVYVVDTTAPVITLNGANPLTNECHAAFVDPGATASDTCAGSLGVTTNSTVNPNAVGVYTIIYTATDPSGNSATNTRTVYVVDTTPPVITLNGANPLTNQCHAAFVDPGATASDTCAGSVGVTTNSTVNPNAVGVYTIKYIATDPSGNSATNTRTVYVVDTTPPVITLNGANPLTNQCHAAFVDPGATASDTCAGQPGRDDQQHGQSQCGWRLYDHLHRHRSERQLGHQHPDGVCGGHHAAGDHPQRRQSADQRVLYRIY